MSKPILVITHAACIDGFCAAWVLRRKFPDAEIVFAHYQNPPPDVTDRDVLMVDFSYPRAVMVPLVESAHAFLVLDHHQTAEHELDGLADELLSRGYRRDLTVTFDRTRSGAGLAWDYFFPGEERPWLVDYVEDRDLWRFALASSREINAYISVLPFNFVRWNHEARCDLHEIAERGSVVAAKIDQYVTEVSKNLRWCDVAGYRVPVVNAAHVDMSEVLDAILRGRPAGVFAVGWFQLPDGSFKYSLRSREGFDVSEVAKQFGGGGHAQASGFTSPTMVHV